MMRKILPVFALASVMLATSCSNEELNSVAEGTNSTVTLTAQLDNGMKSRAFADGTTATTLDYAVYLVDGDDWTLLDKLSKSDEEINMSKTITMNLVNGKTYAVVFWADAPQSIYTFSATDKKVTADYTNATCSNESYDAFYAVDKFTVDGNNLTQSVRLKRPFAQLNIGTADLEVAATAGIDVKKTSVTAPTYNTLNFVDESVDGTKTDVTFKVADLPVTDDKNTFPADKDAQKYLAMNYLLMPTDKTADNTVTISYYGEDGTTKVADDREFQNIPLQRNYRTNIYGNLLTSTNIFNVNITPEFEGPDIDVWDGSVKEVTETAGWVYEIYEASELAWIAQQTVTPKEDGTYEHFKDKAIILMNDIDLANIPWTPIGGDQAQKVGYTVPTYFQGRLVGGCHTIYNLNVSSTSTPDIAAAGLIGGAINITVYDLTLKHVTVKSTHYAGAIVGAIVNNNYSSIFNCTVDDATITSTPALKADNLDETITTNYDNGDKAGGLVGFGQGVQLLNNNVSNTTVTAYRDLGGVAGNINNSESYAIGNSISNVTLIVDNTHNYKSYTKQSDYNVQSFVGRYDSNIEFRDNYGTANIKWGNIPEGE